jgi:ribosomal protein S18 acetylase RimI-like enzyme
LEIRPGSPEDALDIATLFIEVRATMKYLPVLHTPEETREYFAGQLLDQESLLAVEGGTLVGFAIFGGGWLHHLYVRERGSGIGSKLIEAVRRESPTGVQLWTFQANQGARRFYERHGFAVAEETNGAGNEERLPDVRYKST